MNLLGEHYAAEGEAARKIYHNAGLHNIALALGTSHPRAIEYLQQAPVLLFGPMQGFTLINPQRLRSAAALFGAIVAKGPRLRDLMAHYDILPPLRKLKPWALAPSHAHLIWCLGETEGIHPSALAQSIPEKATQQRRWLSGLANWVQCMQARRYSDRTGLAWIAQKLGPELVPAQWATVPDLVDFYVAPEQAFDERWTFEQALNASRRWHAQAGRLIARDCFELTYGIGFEDVVPFGAWPETGEIEGFDFKALNSGDLLHEEGAAMHHCVRSYARHLVLGFSRVYSIRKNGKRVATVEFRAASPRHWGPGQIKGPCNETVGDDVAKAALKFFSFICLPADAKADAKVSGPDALLGRAG